MNDNIKALPKLREMQSRFIETYQLLCQLPDEQTERYIRGEVERLSKSFDDAGLDITRESVEEIVRQLTIAERKMKP